MSLRRPVAAFARDGRESGLAKLIVSAGNEVHRIGVAEDTAFGDGVSEIKNVFRLITGSHIPHAALRIIRNGRLEEERGNRNKITETDFAGANGIGDRIFRN